MSVKQPIPLKFTHTTANTHTYTGEIYQRALLAADFFALPMRFISLQLLTSGRVTQVIPEDIRMVNGKCVETYENRSVRFLSSHAHTDNPSGHILFR